MKREGKHRLSGFSRARHIIAKVFSKEVISEPPPVKEGNMITLSDNNGVIRLSVSLENLYYIESNDNYVNVWHLDAKGRLSKHMLRCRIGTIEERFKGTPLVRCHRKYIVNLDRVKMVRKESPGYELDLDNDYIEPLPVSRTYKAGILKAFNSVS